MRISDWSSDVCSSDLMEAMGVPGALLPAVIALELGGGLAILAGAYTRWVALAIAAFSIASAALFHADFGDPAQAVSFWKNVAMAGGRSEEHTSELQSLMRISYAVFCLKKKKEYYISQNICPQTKRLHKLT